MEPRPQPVLGCGSVLDQALAVVGHQPDLAGGTIELSHRQIRFPDRSSCATANASIGSDLSRVRAERRAPAINLGGTTSPTADVPPVSPLLSPRRSRRHRDRSPPPCGFACGHPFLTRPSWIPTPLLYEGCCQDGRWARLGTGRKTNLLSSQALAGPARPTGGKTLNKPHQRWAPIWRANPPDVPKYDTEPMWAGSSASSQRPGWRWQVVERDPGNTSAGAAVWFRSPTLF